MKLFTSLISIEPNRRTSQSRHFFELEDFLPFILSIDPTGY
jgi:hypothetical protein